MRFFLLSILMVFIGSISAQNTSAAAADTVFTTPNWEETTFGVRKGYVLTLTPEGNFEEDAGEDHNRPYRYLLGRWKVDSAANTLTLSVDGQMGKTGVHRRYLKGRDFYLVYRIEVVSNKEMVLHDVLTGERRTFVATVRKEYVEPAMRRLPKPATEPGVFKLPKGWGGLSGGAGI